MQKHLLTALAALCFVLATTAQPTAGLVAYWPMNGNFSDLGGSAINGTNVGATASTNNVGAVNGAMNFSNPGAYNVVPQYATHPINANLSFGTAQDFSIDFMTYVSSPIVHACGFYDNNLNYGGYGVWMWNASGFLQIQFNFKNGSVGTTNGALVTDTWYHICCLRSAGTLKIYINGVLNASASEGTTAPVYTYPARFGTMFFNAQTPPQYNGLNGKIDELRVYNRALSAAEVLSLGTLPVKLSSFTATKINADVLLNWQTEYEQNSSHFNMQRSTDGINFTTIGTVQAKGTTTVKSDYQYTDNTVNTLSINKTIFYRLQQVDKDNRSQLSNIVPVKFESTDKLMLVLQNPVESEIRLQVALKQAEQVNLALTDAAGKTIFAKQITMPPGQTFTTLPLNNFNSGTYYITITAGTQKQTLPFMKQ